MRSEMENADLRAALEAIALHYTTRTKSAKNGTVNFLESRKSAF